jgi:hypothetical protein
LIGISKETIFNITVNAAVPVGTPVDLSYFAEAGMYSVEKQYVTVVGLLLEDFETGTFEKFAWNFAGNADWFISTDEPYEGINCAQSGDIGDVAASELLTIVQVSSDDSISFYKKVSCEDDPWNDNYDFLVFTIDGIEMGRWDGEVEWSREVYPVTAGEHEFKWMYYKDFSVSSGSDCAWLDYIVFPPVSDYVTIENITDINSDINIYPNPLTNSTNIILSLEKNASVNIELYNAVGQKIMTIVNKTEMKCGIHSFNIDATSLKEGLYFCILNSGNIITTKKLIILK